MPRIIDHDAYRMELAAAAATLFSKNGYSALGMREIARELGLSKSALYHYFPSKKALFAASSAVVTQGVADAAEKLAQVPATNLESRIELMRQLFDELTPGIADEVTLMMDYLRGRSPEEIAADESMQLANTRYKALFEALAGEAYGSAAYCLLLGALLQQHFDGGQTTFADIKPALELLLKT
ncbi:TetR/AcrR family transcriptional regulator [Rhizobium sp. L1K21]|uniref:TetR/AcrR family transcriptional regulator n=1 Tax=Rhizobium sp. L1K21 TaxID=2954933 RepID=UPI00209360D8|nr:TetR/AcrR family transcriptional regulator [Rhizobium sp. L1K21]MCO6186798.1 TetR/AcrR family transcriptional regulator [Rhizobium sp. L1K21]